MVKYSCEKCGKEFTQKGQYTKHNTKKIPCVFESKIEELIENDVSKKIDDITSNTSTNIITHPSLSIVDSKKLEKKALSDSKKLEKKALSDSKKLEKKVKKTNIHKDTETNNIIMIDEEKNGLNIDKNIYKDNKICNTIMSDNFDEKDVKDNDEGINIIMKTLTIDEKKVFTKKEIENYNRQQDNCFYKNPNDEYLWAKTQKKTCSKCLIEKNLCDFNGNTSGRDAFDKNGYRLRRPECNECTKNVNNGKCQAKKKAKDLGISYTAPEGILCAVCNKSATSGNGIVFDHCHTKNIFRGYCCNSCNRSIGVLGDNIDGLLNALNYLLKSEKCIIIQNENGELIKL